jgi:hypothetical protein
MGLALLDGLAGSIERLADHLAAEDACPAIVGAATLEPVVSERFEIEDREQSVRGWVHRLKPARRGLAARAGCGQDGEHQQPAIRPRQAARCEEVDSAEFWKCEPAHRHRRRRRRRADAGGGAEAGAGREFPHHRRRSGVGSASGNRQPRLCGCGSGAQHAGGAQCLAPGGDGCDGDDRDGHYRQPHA